MRILQLVDTAWQVGPYPGVWRRTLVTHEDDRGAFREVWRRSWLDGTGVGMIAQVNESRTRAGALRGLHFHLNQTDIWIITDGEAEVGLVDLRAEPRSNRGARPSSTERLGPGDGVIIPARVAHGLWASSDVRMLYFVTNEYDGTDEHGFAWNDPQAAVAWPTGVPVLSERDRSAPSLHSALEHLRRYPA